MKIETKYNLQDPVYYIDDNKVQFERVSSINIQIHQIRDTIIKTVYVLGNGHKIPEEEFYATKEQLLKSL